MSTAVIWPCQCANTFQDRRYGKGKRVMNKTTKRGRIRCTACVKEHDMPGYDGGSSGKNTWGKNDQGKKEEKKK